MGDNCIKFNIGKLLYFPVDNTHKLWYRFFGKKELPLVIYIHGGPGGYHDLSLKKYINLKKYSFLAYDQRGCGKSVPFLSIENNNFEANLEDLHKLINNFSPNRTVTLIGDSYGTQLAIKYAINYPKLVDKLILTGLWLGSKDDTNSLYNLKCQKYSDISLKLFGGEINISEEFQKIKDGKNINNWLTWEDFLGSPFKDELHKIILNEENYFDVSKENKAIAFFESFYFSQETYFKNQITYDDLSKLSKKLEIFHGSFDEVCLPLNIARLEQSKIKYTIIPDMGHMPESEYHHKLIFKSLS